MTIDYYVVAQSILGLFFFWMLVYFGVREYRVDAFRQRLFVLRDQLFDYAASGAVSFDDPAYGRLRNPLNCLIRFAHRITGSHLVLSDIARAICIRTADAQTEFERPHVQLMSAINATVDNQVRDTLLRIHAQTVAEIFRYLFLGSPLTAIYILARVAWDIVSRRTPASRDDNYGLSTESLEDEAVLSESEWVLEPVA